MTFQIKDFASIVLGMTNRAKATQDTLTDFRVGSVARTLFESPSAEIDELYQQMWIGLKEAIPVAVFRGFSFGAADAYAARGYVNIAFAGPLVSPISIPSGTVFNSLASTNKYATDSAVVVPIGATSVRLLVVCTALGAIGNAPANDVVTPAALSLPIGATVTSDAMFSGKDAETEDERKYRFAEYISNVSRGTLQSMVAAAYRSVIRDANGAVIEAVGNVGAAERAGNVDLYLYGRGVVVSDAMVLAVQKLIDGFVADDGSVVPGYRPAGVRAIVWKTAERFVDVTLNVRAFVAEVSTSATNNLIETAVALEFSRTPSGGILRLSQITDAALSVANVREAFASNTANIECGAHEVIRLGALTVVWLDA